MSGTLAELNAAIREFLPAKRQRRVRHTIGAMGETVHNAQEPRGRGKRGSVLLLDDPFGRRYSVQRLAQTYRKGSTHVVPMRRQPLNQPGDQWILPSGSRL
ncbi:MAG TPA: hypothetical protein VNP04_05930 [Alphaproteobacteria bacterium]|nr:hypothetical protein [Alphaproteobacteria bacterium]